MATIKAAFLFDFDGVIIDSHDAHEKSWQALMGEIGQTLPEGFFKATFGMRNQQIIPQFFSWVEDGDDATIQKLGDRKEEIYRESLRQNSIQPLPGVKKLLREARDAGIPCAVGSSTPRANLDFILELLGLREHFQAICGAEDVTRGKPAPDIFFRAAAALQASPANSLVFEDAFVGLEAARAAGMKSVAVASTNPLESLHAHATLAVQDLTSVTVPILLDLLAL